MVNAGRENHLLLIVWRKFYDCESSPTEFAISDIPTNAILDGFSLVVIYNDGDDTNNRDLTILNGNDVNFGTGSFISWSTDVLVNPQAVDDVSVDLHISDVEWRSSEYMGSIIVNGVEVSSKDNPLAIPTPKFIDSEYWDVATFPVTGLTAGAINTVSGSFSVFVPSDDPNAISTQDCQSLVAVVVSVPTWKVEVSAPIESDEAQSEESDEDDVVDNSGSSGDETASTGDVSGDDSGSDSGSTDGNSGEGSEGSDPNEGSEEGSDSNGDSEEGSIDEPKDENSGSDSNESGSDNGSNSGEITSDEAGSAQEDGNDSELGLTNSGLKNLLNSKILFAIAAIALYMH